MLLFGVYCRLLLDPEERWYNSQVKMIVVTKKNHIWGYEEWYDWKSSNYNIDS